MDYDADMIGKLSLSHLHLLVALHRHRSVTDAAAALNLSQSAASHQIREMERRLDVELFERRKNRLFFTPAGEKALASARVITEEATDLEAALERVRGRSDAKIRIGVRAYNCHWWLARFLRDTSPEFLAQDIQLVADDNRLPLETLRSGDVDLALTPSTYGLQQFSAQELFKDQIVAVLPSAHPLAALTHLEAHHFAEDPYITYSAMHEAGLEYDRLMKPAGMMPGPGLMVMAGSTDACLSFVSQGLGLTCLPRAALGPKPLKKGLKLRPLTAQGIGITWRLLMPGTMAAEHPAKVFAQRMADWAATNLAAIRP